MKSPRPRLSRSALVATIDDERTRAHYDTLTLEIEKAGALVALVADRLEHLAGDPGAGEDVFALGLVTCAIGTHLEAIRHEADALVDGR